MPNIVFSVVEMLSVITTTTVSASPARPGASGGTPGHLNDSLSKMPGTRASPAAPPHMHTALSWAGVTPAPSTLLEVMVFKNLSNTDDLTDLTRSIMVEGMDAVVPEEEGSIDTFQEDVGTTGHQQEDHVVTHQDEANTVSHQTEVPTAGHQEEVDINYQDEAGVSGYQEQVGTTGSEDVTITTFTKESHEVGKGSAGVNPGKRGRVPIKTDQLFKCHCEGQEVLTSSGCKSIQDNTFIHVEKYKSDPVLISVADLTIVKQDVHCEVEKGDREMNFTKGQFYWRKRGDVVLLVAAGDLRGLRIENYCIIHQLDERESLTWMMKACVYPPTVPTCCPPGQALQHGTCHPAPIPHLLKPDITTFKFKDKKDWSIIRNQQNNISCTDDTLRTITLSSEESFLVTVPEGVLYLKENPENLERPFLKRFHEYCVNAHQKHDGSVRYSANFCFYDPKERQQIECVDSICVRKCCPIGEIYIASRLRCDPYADAMFKPNFTTTPSQYKIVTGNPSCSYTTEIKGIAIDEKGHLQYNDRTLHPFDYCTDQFSDGKGNIRHTSLVCLEHTSEWYKVRIKVFRICYIISLIFLLVRVLCQCMVPVLLQRGGWHQLGFVVSLMITYTSTFIQQSDLSLDITSCFAVGLMMQFGFLATFFWLSVLCFDAWRKFRSSNLNTVSEVPLWVYSLYAFGGPFTIGMITALMQFLAPDDVPGVIKPDLVKGGCWLNNDIHILLYLYGPIAFLCACNIAFNVQTCRNIYKKGTPFKNFISEQPSQGNNTAGMATFRRHCKQDTVSEFKEQFFLLVVMSSCWICEVLSWKIPPPELWSLADVVNALQGFLVFVIFVANRRRRRHLKERFPKLFTTIQNLKLKFQKVTSFVLCKDTNNRSLSSVGSTATQARRYLQTFWKHTSSSYDLTSHEHRAEKCSPGNESKSSITILYMSQSISPTKRVSDTPC